MGEKDFTRPLLEWLGFEIVFSQVNVRPGRPLIFGVNGSRAAFGLPGNPLSHFVCFHLFVATALAKLTGQEAPGFCAANLQTKLEDAACPRETLWPARLEFLNGELRLHPLEMVKFRRRDLSGGDQRTDPRSGESRFARRGSESGFSAGDSMMDA